MKKKLEADLISIAHRILKMKNKSDVMQLHQEAQRLYEKLSVLKFVEEHFSRTAPTFDYTKAEEHLAVIFENDIPAAAPEPHAPVDIEVPASENSSEKDKQKQPEIIAETAPETERVMENEGPISQDSSEEAMGIPAEIAGESEAEESLKTVNEPSPEIVPETPQAENKPVEQESPVAQQEPEVAEETDIEEAPAKSVAETSEPESHLFKPSFELSFDAKPDEPIQTPSHPIKETQFAFDDLLGKGYTDPVFVKPEELEKERMDSSSVIPIARSYTENSPVISMNTGTETLPMNERLGKGLTIGLNDRIAFMNHLFNNSSEDYNRVLSQLITFGTLAEAKNFIDNMVKPDYNDWKGKEEYEQRFMEIIEKRFA